MMNILLIKAAQKGDNAVTQPIGLAYLASYLRKQGQYNLKLIDLRLSNYSLSDLDCEVKMFSPNVVGISALTFEALAMHKIAESIKKIIPMCKIIAGGPHATSFTRETLNDQNIDCAVLGEGEVTFYELIKTFEKGEDINSVKGIAFRKNGGINITPPREYIENLDNIPFPAWDILDIEAYKKFKSMSTLGKRRYMVLCTSRSCPYRCIYCHNMFGKGFRARSPENVVEEIDLLYNKYGITEFEIIDDIFNLDVERAEKICDIITERNLRIGIAFPNGLRSDRLEKRTLDKMRAAGTKFISFAVESASPRLQKLIKKNLKLDKVKESIDYASKLGILTNGFFMLGFPTETEEEVQKTIKFALKSNLHTAYFFTVTPFEGTELYEKFYMNNVNKTTNYTQYLYKLSTFNLSNVSSKKIKKMRQVAYFRFYLNPMRILKIISIYLKISNNPFLPLNYLIALFKRIIVY